MSILSFQPILDAALADYSRQVGINLATHPLADSLRSCGSPDDVLRLLENKAKEFKDFRDGNRKLIDWLSPVVQVVHALSAVLGPSTSMVGRKSSFSWYPFHRFFHGIFITRFQRRRSSPESISSSQYAPYGAFQRHCFMVSGYYRQPVASARATMHLLTCSNASEISSNAFGSTVIFP